MKKLLFVATLMSSVLTFASPISVNSVSAANITKSASKVETTEMSSGCFFTDSHGNIWEFVKIPSDNATSDITYSGITAYKYSGDTPSYVHEYGFMMNNPSISNITYDDVVTCKRLILKEDKSSEVKKYDLYPDGYIDITDATLMYQYYVSTPYNFVSNGTKSMEANIFWKIFEQKASTENKITIMYGDVPSDTTASTTAKTTPTTVRATSTTSKTTTTARTTPTTVRATSTTSKMTTTARTTSTTTAKNTSTTSNTTTTAKATSTTTVRNTSATFNTTTTAKTTSTTSSTTALPPTTGFEVPRRDNLIDPYGNKIIQSLYDDLIQAANDFDLRQYKIIYTEEPIMYSIIVPDELYTSFTEIMYGAYQLAPSFPTIKDYFPDLYAEDFELGFDDEQYIYCYNRLLYRPCYENSNWFILDEDYKKKCIEQGYIVTTFPEDEMTPSLWALIPLDENGNEVLQFLGK